MMKSNNYSINERIVLFCKIKGIKQVDLELSGYGSKQMINMIFKDRRKPNCLFLERLANDNEDLDVRWLLTGVKKSKNATSL